MQQIIFTSVVEEQHHATKIDLESLTACLHAGHYTAALAWVIEGEPDIQESVDWILLSVHSTYWIKLAEEACSRLEDNEIEDEERKTLELWLEAYVASIATTATPEIIAEALCAPLLTEETTRHLMMTLSTKELDTTLKTIEIINALPQQEGQRLYLHLLKQGVRTYHVELIFQLSQLRTYNFEESLQQLSVIEQQRAREFCALDATKREQARQL